MMMMRMVTTDTRPSLPGGDFLSIMSLRRVPPVVAHSGRLDLKRRRSAPSLNDRGLGLVRSVVAFA